MGIRVKFPNMLRKNWRACLLCFPAPFLFLFPFSLCLFLSPSCQVVIFPLHASLLIVSSNFLLLEKCTTARFHHMDTTVITKVGGLSKYIYAMRRNLFSTKKMDSKLVVNPKWIFFFLFFVKSKMNLLNETPQRLTANVLGELLKIILNPYGFHFILSFFSFNFF